MTDYIYVLVDPRYLCWDRRWARYVGKSIHPIRRYTEHSGGRLYSTRFWIEELRSQGWRPDMRIVGTTNMAAEDYWIHRFLKRGYALLNKHPGDGQKLEKKHVSEARLPFCPFEGISRASEPMRRSQEGKRLD
jgi:hypothetical protein